MRIAEASRGLSLRSVIVAAFLVVPNGSLFADVHLDPSLQDCVRHLPEAKLEDQLLCLHRLRQVGRAASAATLLLTEMLSNSDGATDHALVASMLDVLRSLGPVAAPAAETLSALLPHRCKLYRDRDKMLVARLRAHILLTLSDIGIPSSSLRAVDQRAGLRGDAHHAPQLRQGGGLLLRPGLLTPRDRPPPCRCVRHPAGRSGCGCAATARAASRVRRPG